MSGWRDDLSIAVSNAQHDGATAAEVAEAFEEIMDNYYSGETVTR